MALEPEEYEFDFPAFKRKTKLLEETAESSFEKDEPSHGDDVPERFEIFDRKISSTADLYYEGSTNVLDQMATVIIQRRGYEVLLEMWGETEERITDEIALSAAKLKSDVENVKIMLNGFNYKIVNEEVAKPETSSLPFFSIHQLIKRQENQKAKQKKRQAIQKAIQKANQKAKSEIPNRLRYCKDEIKTTAELLEKMFQEIDENVGFTKSSGYETLREFNHYLLDHIEKCDIESIAKIAESSVAKVEPQSKGVVSKKNALRRQHNSQRDDPDEELSRDQVEMKATLVECVFRIPQQPRFITALGYTPILVA